MSTTDVRLPSGMVVQLNTDGDEFDVKGTDATLIVNDILWLARYLRPPIAWYYGDLRTCRYCGAGPFDNAGQMHYCPTCYRGDVSLL